MQGCTTPKIFLRLVNTYTQPVILTSLLSYFSLRRYIMYVDVRKGKFFHSSADTHSSLLAKNSRPVIKASTANAPIPPFLPAKVIAVIITPAATTPVKIDDRATAVGIPNRNAPIAPVHAPVPGRGIPTNAARDAHCFWIDPTPRLADFFSARERMGPISFLCHLVMIRKLNMKCINHKHLLQRMIPQQKQYRNNRCHVTHHANWKNLCDWQTHPNSHRNCASELYNRHGRYNGKDSQIGNAKGSKVVCDLLSDVKVLHCLLYSFGGVCWWRGDGCYCAGYGDGKKGVLCDRLEYASLVMLLGSR
jgi:hypothetical protein